MSNMVILPRRIVSGYRAALGVGPGYEPQPLNESACFDGAQVGGYYVDLRAKTLSQPTPQVSGRGVSHGVSATNLAQHALGWYDRALHSESGAADAFLAACERLRRAGELSDVGLVWRYEVAVAKYRRSSGWYSAMAQGQAASAFVRAYQSTGSEHWAAAARAAITPLLRETDLGLVRVDEAGPILEECPSDPPSSILNGWLYALWGLRDVSVVLCDEHAARMFSESTLAASSSLSRFDVGWWSLYSLYPAFADVATPFYHRIHVAQLRATARLSGRLEFESAADAWQSYVRRPAEVRAIGTKVYRALRDSRRVSAVAA